MASATQVTRGDTLGFRIARIGKSGGRSLVQVSSATGDPDGRVGGAQRAGGAALRSASRAQYARDGGGLFDGLEACSQNRWPSLALDVGAINSLLSPVFIAGFYYKTFMWPAALLGKILRQRPYARAAGLGRASLEADPDRTRRTTPFATCWSSAAARPVSRAALAAGRAGARVILCDEDFVLGGRLNGDRHEIDGTAGALWAEADRRRARLDSPRCGS